MLLGENVSAAAGCMLCKGEIFFGVVVGARLLNSSIGEQLLYLSIVARMVGKMAASTLRACVVKVLKNKWRRCWSALDRLS